MDSFSDASVNLSNFLGSVHNEAPNLDSQSDYSLPRAKEATLFYKGVFLFIAIFIAALLAYTALNRTLCEASIGQGGVQVAAKFAYEAKESR